MLYYRVMLYRNIGLLFFTITTVAGDKYGISEPVFRDVLRLEKMAMNQVETIKNLLLQYFDDVW